MNYNSETNEYNQGKNDCAIVSIANFLKCDYQRVIEALRKVGGEAAIKTLPISGVSTPNSIAVLKLLTGRHWYLKTIRRGAEKHTGFASWHRPGKNQGHLTIVKCGLVVETDSRRIWLDDYRKLKGYVLRGIIVYV